MKEKKVLNYFKYRLFTTKNLIKFQHASRGIKILTPKQMLQRLTIALPPVACLKMRILSNHIFFVSSKRNY